ncbi:uncharacterized protein LOC123263208 isoform X1 [Cotesia glomerata]|uniref:uncharacterized protein LOC123263208 isoform X1 n=1 Tax=Cotesia glomerata TaxID=32391 RepID=UPI001D00A6F1|nr:uncharacterized protein LOC123263208 isoform X1 [Cotesia glomerata]
MTDYVFIEDNFLYSLKMNAIIDFNGFYNSGNEYVIKEYSIRLIRDGTNEETDGLHRVSKKLTGWKVLSKNARNRYRDYFKTYGISWKTGTHGHKFIVKELWDVLRNSRTIYLLYEGKRNMLANYLGDELNFRFEYFKEMGFDFKPDLHTECRYHEHPKKNNCANDNVSKMVEWFTARITDFLRGNLIIVIDFNGWYFSDEEYMIKEYAMYFIHNKTNQVIFRDLQVSKAPVLWDQLDKYKRNEWEAYYRIYGIEWNHGTCDTESIKKNLKDKFRSSQEIYVRDQKNHNLLKKYLDYDFEASRLTDMNLEFEDKMATKCKNHIQRSKNNCANDNASKMISLLSQTFNQPKLNIVIDFNGCMINKKYVVKEYSLYVVENETYEVIRNDFEVSRPPIKKEQLNKKFQDKCTDYTNEFGIDWDYGTRDYETIKKYLQQEFRNSYKIYVIRKTKYRLLQNYLNGKLRSNFVYLKKLGFEFKPKMSTSCSNHQEPLNKNCANDNVEEMLSWLQDKKPEANNVTKINFSGLTMPKFERPIKFQASNETKAEDNGSKRFKFNRETEPEVSDTTSSVPSPPMQKSTIERSLLPNPPPIPKSSSAASLIPSPPPMAKNDSVQNLIPNPPPMSKSSSLASLVPTPPPMTKIGSVENLIPNPPPMSKSSSIASLVPTPPPMLNGGSVQNLIPTPPPMSKSNSSASLTPSSVPMSKSNSLASLIPSPPMQKTTSERSLLPNPPPILKSSSAASPMTKIGSVKNLKPNSPPMSISSSLLSLLSSSPSMSESSSLANLTPNPPMEKTASEGSILSNPPPMQKFSSAASLVPSPPPMTKIGSEKNLTPISPPMLNASNAVNAVASSSTISKSNSFAEPNVSDPNKNTISFLDDLNNAIHRLKPVKKNR